MRSNYEKNPEKHPFFRGSINGNPFFAVSAADRICAVKFFTAAECLEAVNLPEFLQKSVRSALQSRLRQLEKSK